MARMTRTTMMALGGVFLALVAQAQTNAVDIDRLVREMSLDEKIGQMMQITLDTVVVNGATQIKLDEAKLREAIVTNRVGSFLNTGLNHALSAQDWNYVLTTIQDMALKETPHHIPLLYGIDSIHGATYTLGSTIFPQNLDMAATRDVDLMRRTAEISAAETRAVGLPWVFAPVLDVGRQPLWPRYAESFGEDPTLGAIFGRDTVEGFQDDDVSATNHVAACMKHYLGYSFPFSGKDRSPALIPDYYLREYFLPPFRAAVQAGVKSVMVNSAEVNGVPVHASKYLLTDVLRGELGFDGVILSDWEDVKHLHDWYRVADSQQEAARLAVEAGIDISMVPTDYSFGQYLKELVKDGKIPERRIDESVRRILKLKLQVGLFDNPYPVPGATNNIGRPEYQQVALQAAEEAVTLLKNANATLPLSKTARVLVAGPAADSLSALHGSWSYTWQGWEEQWFPKTTRTILGAIREKIGTNNVTYLEGAGFAGESTNSMAVEDAARDVDVVVLCLGENSYAEAVGDVPNLTLPRNQIELAQLLYATGKPVVLVLAEGRGRIIRDIEPGAKAILFAGWPGSQGAPAIANILFGDTNPSGKLAFTYQRYPDNLITYDRTFLDIRASQQPPIGFRGIDFTPQWEFGTGLSYTTFAYTNLTLSAATLKKGGKLTATVDVTNTGQRAGKEAVELYSRELYASVDPPGKRLRAFQKIDLAPGQTRTVSFELTPADLAFVNARSKLVTEPGTFEVMVGGLTASFEYKE
jgi:beta-glucosidase